MNKIILWKKQKFYSTKIRKLKWSISTKAVVLVFKTFHKTKTKTKPSSMSVSNGFIGVAPGGRQLPTQGKVPMNSGRPKAWEKAGWVKDLFPMAQSLSEGSFLWTPAALRSLSRLTSSPLTPLCSSPLLRSLSPSAVHSTSPHLFQEDLHWGGPGDWQAPDQSGTRNGGE